MFCENCGKKLEDHLKFCTNCGTVVSAPAAVKAPTEPAPAAPQPPVQPPVYPVTPAPTPKPKKKFNPLFVILPVGAVVAILVVVLLISLFSGVLGGGSVKVLAAFAKTAEAYSSAYNELDLPKMDIPVEDGVFNTTASVKINKLPYASELEGIGVKIEASSNLPESSMYMKLTPAYGNIGILDAKILLNGSKIYASVPELTGDHVYMVNTETLGMDLVDLGIADPETADLGFNIFNIINKIKEASGIDEEAKELLTDAAKTLSKEIEVEKIGKEETSVNGKKVKCTVYRMTLSEDAMEEFVNTVMDVMEDTNTTDVYMDILKSIGLPDYVLDEISYELDVDGIYNDLSDVIDDVLNELGDLELDIYLSKGYVMSIYYENSIDDVDVELTIDLGGGKNYVDDLSIELFADDVEIVLESNGNHSCQDGVFTDTTTLDVNDGYDKIRISSEFSFEPKASDENFNWSVKVDDFKAKVIGQITLEEKFASVKLDKIELSSGGTQALSVSLETTVSEYEDIGMSTKNSYELLKMSEDELMAEMEYLEETATSWAMSFVAGNPELMDLIGSIMYY